MCVSKRTQAGDPIIGLAITRHLRDHLGRMADNLRHRSGRDGGYIPAKVTFSHCERRPVVGEREDARSVADYRDGGTDLVG